MAMAETASGDTSPDFTLIHEDFVPGTRTEVVISWFKSPQDFHCRLSCQEENLLALMIAIQCYYQGKEPMSKLPPVGEPVIAIFSVDENFQRGIVIQHCSKQSALVQYVDFGNFEVVDVSRLWKIEKQFMDLPTQALPCTLMGAKPVAAEWPKDSLVILKYVYSDQLDCIFHYKTDKKFAVSLFLNGNSLMNEMVSSGIAIMPRTGHRLGRTRGLRPRFPPTLTQSRSLEPSKAKVNTEDDDSRKGNPC